MHFYVPTTHTIFYFSSTYFFSTMVQYESLESSDVYVATLTLLPVTRLVKKGIEFDISITIRSTSNNKVIWGAFNSFLVFHSHKYPISTLAVEEGSNEISSEVHKLTAAKNVPLSSDVGRKYALLCGDWNPVHISKITAKLFGFKMAIAHGMYISALAISALQREGIFPKTYPVTVEVIFRRPCFIPTSINVSYSYVHLATNSNTVKFSVLQSETANTLIRGQCYAD